MAPKKTRKLPMAKREDAKKVSVSFTKRRQGLFNKAAELSLLCDAQIAVLVDSPCKKPKRKSYSFGHASVGAILDAYINDRIPEPTDDNRDKQSALSLMNEIKALEAEVNNEKKLNKAEGFSCFEKSKSVKGLQLLVDGLQELIDKAKSRINNSAIVIANDDDNGFLDDDSPNGLYTLPPSDDQPTSYVRSDAFPTTTNHAFLSINYDAFQTSNIALQDTDYNYHTNEFLQTGNNGYYLSSLSESAPCFSSNEFLSNNNEAAACSFIADPVSNNNFGYVNYNHNFVGGNSNSRLDNNWSFTNSCAPNFSLADVTEEHGNNFNVSPLDFEAIGTLSKAHQQLPGAYGHGDFSFIDTHHDSLWS